MLYGVYYKNVRTNTCGLILFKELDEGEKACETLQEIGVDAGIQNDAKISAVLIESFAWIEEIDRAEVKEIMQGVFFRTIKGRRIVSGRSDVMLVNTSPIALNIKG